MCQESRHILTGLSAPILSSQNSNRVILEDSTGDGSAFKLIWVVGKIHFLAVAGLRRVLGFADYGLEATHSSLLRGPLRRQFTTWLFASFWPVGVSLSAICSNGNWYNKTIMRHATPFIILVRIKSQVPMVLQGLGHWVTIGCVHHN